ncbi:replication factor C large subunit [Methanocella arvoryzae]|uniref:Replication factor C large subunit n=1 Tax=Methanocella arvoryzae (strain DSM 22066 / NBRC 105507 / MRE50) TaxID=351160 RepID=RFCL_METAR|nr:replication factor C large subunit [Methanocella arvoryzae]Q0W3P4.1 RecName: Full=Replication factor C large subunit; Short=RFC large subunit; AltName: Full=Clamp loader large subunit [Methanocella arvoryzae MRE50]CAJ36999.1 replication factor C, large subunit [Methanocella arvoryzae MRE50]
MTADNDTRDWTEKYRPVSLADIVGNDAAVKALRQWAETFGTGKKAVILYGGPGVGKTSAALALAHDMGWDYIELNASDVRTKDAINRIAGPAAMAGTFEGTGGRRLVILDEADNLHGNYDRGGEAAIINVIRNASQPVILIANDMYAMSKPLRESALQIQFRAILSTSVAKVLRKVCANEGLKCDPEALMKIAERTNDLRSAINDLQAAAQGSGQVTVADVSTGDRDVPETIFKVMGMIFRGKNMREALNATYGLDENPEDLIGWVDENLPREYQDDDLERGFEALSRADVYLGRTRRRQDYGMWRYAGFMMVCGVNRARRRHYGGFSRYSPPTYWQKLGRAKSTRVTRDSIAAKVGKACHCSKAEARSTYLPLLRFLFDKDEYAIRLSAQLKLEEDEIAFLLDAKKASKKVGEIYKKSRALIEEEIEEEIDLFARFGKRPGKPEAGEPRESLFMAGEEEEKPSREKSAKLDAFGEIEKPKRKRRKAPDGGAPIEDGPEEPGEAPMAAAMPAATESFGPAGAPAPQESPLPEPEKPPAAEDKCSKKQRTLFDF